MTAPESEYFERVMSQLSEFGLLLESDSKLPSVSGIVTGTPLHGSWWSHPLSHTIFHVNGQLEDHPDLVVTKLVAGKVTFVHKILWPELLAIGTSREPWQTTGLSASAQTLLTAVESNGSVRTDEANLIAGFEKAKVGDAARELERKLLVNAAQFHTETGAHAKNLETWEHWAKRIGFNAPSPSVAAAKNQLEARLKKLNNQFQARARLPWKEPPKKSNMRS